VIQFSSYASRQTHRHTHHNTLQPYWGKVIKDNAQCMALAGIRKDVWPHKNCALITPQNGACG